MEKEDMNGNKAVFMKEILQVDYDKEMGFGQIVMKHVTRVYLY